MSRDEAKKIIAIMIAAYPNYHPVDLGVVVNLWSKMFEIEPYGAVEAALQIYIASNTSGFAPTIGQIKALLNKPIKALNESEAWSLVRRAISRSSYEAEEEFNKLPSEIQSAVGSPNQLRVWARDTEFNDGVESSNFKRLYRNALEQERERKSIGTALTKLIEQYQIGGIDDKQGCSPRYIEG